MHLGRVSKAMQGTVTEGSPVLRGGTHLAHQIRRNVEETVTQDVTAWRRGSQVQGNNQTLKADVGAPWLTTPNLTSPLPNPGDVPQKQTCSLFSGFPWLQSCKAVVVPLGSAQTPARFLSPEAAELELLAPLFQPGSAALSQVTSGGRWASPRLGFQIYGMK